MAASVFGCSLSGHGRLTLFRTPAPGARSLDGRNPAISTSAEQPFRLFEWLQLTLRDDIFDVWAAKAVPERPQGGLCPMNSFLCRCYSGEERTSAWKSCRNTWFI